MSLFSDIGASAAAAARKFVQTTPPDSSNGTPAISDPISPADFVFHAHSAESPASPSRFLPVIEADAFKVLTGSAKSPLPPWAVLDGFVLPKHRP